jgi:hypothetical protein
MKPEKGKKYIGAHCLDPYGKLATIVGQHACLSAGGVQVARLRRFNGDWAGSVPLDQLEILERTYDQERIDADEILRDILKEEPRGSLTLTPERLHLLATAVTEWIENTDEDDPAHQHHLAVARDLQEELDGRIAAAAGYDGPAGSNREDLP